MGQSPSSDSAYVTDELLRPLVGTRVVRGPDWKWGGQDGGEGHLGTLRRSKSGKEVIVVWDNGTAANYRCHDNHDLRILDSGPAGIKHDHIQCDGCAQNPIFGTRWKCTECDDFDLCSACYHGDKHLEHRFWSIDVPRRERKLAGIRRTSRKISARGLFPGAKVIRGIDWEWGSQDGLIPGQPGKVTEIKEWNASKPRSAVNVAWPLGTKNLYRVGFEGKVDVKVTTPAMGYSFYLDHLPILGVSTPCNDPNQRLDVGDRVRVELDVETVKLLQEGHGGWDERMKEVLSYSGKVVGVVGDKGVFVSYPSGNRWMLNSAVLVCDNSNSKPGERLKVGDVVRISNDLERVKALQHDHGGWVDLMIVALGKVGTVDQIDKDGDVNVKVFGMNWTFNPLCLTKLSDIQIDLSDPLSELLKKLLDLETGKGRMDVGELALMKAVTEKDLRKVENLVSVQGVQVNSAVGSHTALHVASQDGAVEIVQFLIRKGANLESQGKDGERPIHHAASKDQVAVIKALAAAGADLNSKDNKGRSALHVAINSGHNESVMWLLKLKARPSLQDSFGDTPLHDAITEERDNMVKVLLDSKADISLTNKKGFSSFHSAAIRGYAGGIQAMLSMGLDPSVINGKKDDGFTALHLAALNNHLKVADLLITKGKADKNVQNSNLQTPLHLAVQGQHVEIVRLLVEEGASLDIADNDGDTPLHEAVLFHTILNLKELQDITDIPLVLALGMTGSDDKSSFSIACLLSTYGADLTVKNRKGQTPLDLCLDSKLSKALSEVHVPKERTATANETTNAGAAGAISIDVGAATHSETNCFVCSDFPRDTLFMPCCHIVVCSQCSPRIKRCLLCEEQILVAVKIEKCCVCGKKKSCVLFKPCGHLCTCNDCAPLLKKCVHCRSPIEERVPYSNLCGGIDPLLESPKKEKQHMFTMEGNIANEEVTNLRQQLTELKDQMVCPICMDRNRNLAFACGHVTCKECGERLRECPVCRRPIEKRVELY